jgi:hypothetical protein
MNKEQGKLQKFMKHLSKSESNQLKENAEFELLSSELSQHIVGGVNTGCTNSGCSGTSNNVSCQNSSCH